MLPSLRRSALWVAFVTGCAGTEAPPLAPGAAVVGPGGGSFVLSGVELTVPPGALSQTVELRIAYAEQEVPADPMLRSRVYRFEPGGLRFQVPITVALPLSAAAISPRIQWSREGELLAFEPRPTRVVDDRAVAEVDHFSYGFVTESSPQADAGLPDAAPLDGTAPDSEAHSDAGVDAAADADVAPDAAEEDLGLADASLDGAIDAQPDAAEPEDLGSNDGAPDLGPLDLGPSDSGAGPDAMVVTIVPASGATFSRDACEARTQLLTSNAGPGAVWSELAPFTGAASVGSDGTLYLDPTGFVISWPEESFAVEVVGPNGSAQASYLIAMNGVSRWIGPIFSGGLTDYSLSSTTTYAAQIAPPEADHPCQPRYRRVTNGPNCSSSPSAVQIDDQGWVTIVGSLAVGVHPVCFAAQWSTVELDRFEGQLNVVP
ncbi:MAG: hypothetical protein IPG45_01525 [Deltaproteobacteria bacterium]|nr:hypothetical protein [Deltaproteobacteria bacterium]